MCSKILLFVCLQASVILATTHASSTRKNDVAKGLSMQPVARDEDALNNSRARTESSLVNEENENLDFKSIVCSSFPTACTRLATFARQLSRLGVFEGRGPKDMIAIVSTMLATLMGAILVKLNVLIVLSLISVGIGKILVLLFSLKSQLFTHLAHHPIVLEKIHHPHHKDHVHQLHHEDYSPYDLSR